MADDALPVIPGDAKGFDRDRLVALLQTLEAMAAGQVDVRLPISARHDVLDAIAFGINALVSELAWANARAREAHEAQAEALRAAVASAEARSSAMLRAIPDLMFLQRRDGTYVDYHARDAKLLFVPPTAFLGRTPRDVFPAPLAEQLMEAFAHACHSDDPALVEYELPMGEPRFFEARIVQAGPDRILTIVREITEWKRALALNRDLARRLITRQELERQRIARELHDDVSQRLALLNIRIDEMAAQATTAPLHAQLRQLSALASEIASDVHHISYDLHPSRLRTLGLVAALESLCRETSTQRNLRVAFTHGIIPSSVDATVSLYLYRIVQEALHNVARHSQASEAVVSVAAVDGHITLQISDAGVGFDPATVLDAGLGLISMRERVAVVNGQLAIDAAPGGGTRVTVRVPLGA